MCLVNPSNRIIPKDNRAIRYKILLRYKDVPDKSILYSPIRECKWQIGKKKTKNGGKHLDARGYHIFVNFNDRYKAKSDTEFWSERDDGAEYVLVSCLCEGFIASGNWCSRPAEVWKSVTVTKILKVF